MAQRTVINQANVIIDGNGSKNTGMVIPCSYDEVQRYGIYEINDLLLREEAEGNPRFDEFVHAFWTREGRLNVLAGLMRVDLGDFNPIRPPRTAAFRKQMRMNLPITQEWLMDEFANFTGGEGKRIRFFDNEIDRASAYNRLKNYAGDLGRRVALPGKEEVANFLVEALGAVKKMTNRKGEPRKRLLVIPDALVAAKNFQKKFDLWPFDDLDEEELEEMIQGEPAETGYSSESDSESE
jgi:hypothetical protein